MKTLTGREEEILRLLASGLKTSSIKERLSISEKTLKKHMEHIYHKLDIHSRYQAVAWAWKNGLVGKSSDSEANR